MKTNEWFFRMGGTAWLAGVGLIAVLAILGAGQVIDGDAVPFRGILLLFGVAGLVAMFIGGILSIWDA